MWTDGSPPNGFVNFDGAVPANADQDCVQTNAGANSMF